MIQSKIHQQLCFLTGNQRGGGGLKEQVPPGTKPDQMLQGNALLKVALPQFRKQLQRLLLKKKRVLKVSML